MKLNRRSILIGLGLVLFIVLVQTRIPADQPKITSAASVHAECENQPQAIDKFDCYERTFGEVIDSEGARQALELMGELQGMGGYAEANCHPLTHKIGNLALHAYGTVLNAVPEYLPVCHSGYYHGLLEEYLATAEDYDTGIKEVCGTSERKDYFNWFQCAHGLGHGVMQYRLDEVLQSLSDCDLLDPEGGAREICYGGVFMENITADEKTGHPSKYIDPDNPIYPCDIVAEQYKASCYFLSSSMILRLNNYDFADAFHTCDTKAEEQYRSLCYQSMGRDVSGSTLRDNDKVIELCMLGSDEYRGECFFGAVRDYINEKGEFDRALEFCALIPETHQGRCFSAVILDLRLFKSGADYQIVCDRIPWQYQYQCATKL